MALRQNLFDQTVFKVLEVNNIAALRNGHLLSQVVLPKNKFLDGSQTYIQNGEIVFLDVDAKLATLNKVGTTDGSTAITNAADVKPQLQPFIIFNEELMTGPYTDLKYFAEVFDADNLCYPRALKLNVGDSFTTDNYVVGAGTQANGAYATINGNGKLSTSNVLPTTAYRGPLFAVVSTTLPDGATAAMEFTVISLNVLFVAD
jgi:hypothetical protein